MRKGSRTTTRSLFGVTTRTGFELAFVVGAVAVAGAVVEAALVPAVVVGAAAVAAPRLFKGGKRPLRRGARRNPAPTSLAAEVIRSVVVEQTARALPKVLARATTVLPTILDLPKTLPNTFSKRLSKTRPRVLPKQLALSKNLLQPISSLRLKEATLKTISFRVIVTVLDFGFNYLILGDIVTSAGLSAFSIVAGPFFYFLHETSWTYLRPLMPVDWVNGAPRSGYYTIAGLRVSHAIAKTITYRIFATASEFTTNFIVVQDLVTAAYLSSFGFFLGPFVYYAHERFWERVDERKAEEAEPMRLLPPPTLMPQPA